MTDEDISKIVHECFGQSSNNLSPNAKLQTNSDNDYPNKTLSNSDSQVLKLQHCLESWREIILQLNSVLLWKKNWHAGAIAGASTAFFLALHLWDPSILTAFSVFSLIITLGDFIVPMAVPTLFKSEWSAAKEKHFNKICKQIVAYKTKVEHSCDSFFQMRTSKPKLFYSIAIIGLIVLAWIGNKFNNLLLTYILVTSLLMVPGLENQGLLQQYGKCLSKRVSDGVDRLKMNQTKKKE